MTKKLKFPRLRFKKDDGTDFPAWEQRKLKDLTSINSGRDYKHLGTGEIPVYGTGGHMLSVDQALSETEDAVGIGRKGTIDKPFLLKAPFWTVDTLFYAVPKENESNLNFLFCLFQKVNWKAKDESTGVPSLAKKTIEATDVVIPTLPEQKKIGELFQQLDSTLTLHQKKLEHLKKLKKSLLQNMFPREGEIFPRLRFPEFTDAWEQRKFGELVRRISGAALSSPEKPGVEYEDINSGEGTLNKDIRLKVGAKKGQPFEPADLLYGKLRPYLKNILLPDFSGVAIGDFWVLRPARYSSTFLFNLIQTPRFEEKANCSAGSKMPRADWKLVSNSIFAVPKDPREAEKIGELFLFLNSTITLHQRKLEKMQLLKKALLQQMFV